MRGVILRLLNFEQKKNNLSPMWGSYSISNLKDTVSNLSLSPMRGSYSYPATMIPKLPEFVLHVGELFCYFNFSLILNSSLSPVRGSYSYDAIEVGKVLQFVPVRGSYSVLRSLSRCN